MKKAVLITLIVASTGYGTGLAQELEDLWFRPSDTLAQRDEYGLVHQSKTVYSTDFEPRHHWRPLYYFESGRNLETQPAYVGSLQKALSRLGYYCGPIDGIFSDDVSVAIAHMQKNYSMTVTGTITVPVRRALHMP